MHPQPETYWGNVNPIGPRGVYDEAKRYAEALTMAYHYQQGVDTGIARIFNSILADEQVLFDDGRELRREGVARRGGAARRPRRACRVRGRSAAAGELAVAQAIEYPLDGFAVPAFASGGAMVAAPASALIAHPPTAAASRCARATGARSGSRATTRSSSRVRTASRSRARSSGSSSATASRSPAASTVPERDRAEVSMLDVWRSAEGDPWDLLVEAPGPRRARVGAAATSCTDCSSPSAGTQARTGATAPGRS